MTADEVFRYFETVRVRELASFRALCNALKALIIERAVAAWRERRQGRLAVLDLGCGRGGDLRKWARFRLKSYVGVDGAAACIEEARERQRGLLSQGRSSLAASFHVANLLTEPAPAEDGSVDVVASMFFLQFTFGDEGSARRGLREAARALRPGGVFCALLPDGDRVVRLLAEARRPGVPFGHFRLQRLPPSAPEPFGVAYTFALVEEACTEYAVSPKWLAAELAALGFEGAGAEGAFCEPAQQFFLRDREAAAAVLREQRCSHADWLSLGFFLAVLARRV